MSAITSFDSFLRAFALVITIVTILKRKFPTLFVKKNGESAFYHKIVIIGERLSLYVAFILIYNGIIKFVNFF